MTRALQLREDVAPSVGIAGQLTAQRETGAGFGAFRGLRIGDIILPAALGALNTNNWSPVDANTLACRMPAMAVTR